MIETNNSKNQEVSYRKYLPVVASVVLNTISDELKRKPINTAGDVYDQLYKNIVDFLPAGCMSEDIAKAGSDLFTELNSAVNCRSVEIGGSK